MMKKKPTILKWCLWGLLILGCLVLFYDCPFRFFLGIPCMGCGMTRAMLACLRLDFVSAFYYHPLFGVVIAIGVFWVLDRMQIYRMESKKRNILLMVVCVLFVLVYLIRLVGHSPIVQVDIRKGLIYRLLFH